MSEEQEVTGYLASPRCGQTRARRVRPDGADSKTTVVSQLRRPPLGGLQRVTFQSRAERTG